jgi:hypothetical protein
VNLPRLPFVSLQVFKHRPALFICGQLELKGRELYKARDQARIKFPRSLIASVT